MVNNHLTVVKVQKVSQNILFQKGGVQQTVLNIDDFVGIVVSKAIGIIGKCGDFFITQNQIRKAVNFIKKGVNCSCAAL